MAAEIFRGRGEIKEENYFFVGGGEVADIGWMGPERGESYFGKLELTVTALQDVFVGSGELEERERRLYDSFSYYKKDTDRQDSKRVKTFTIPGSSMKGSILTNLKLFLKESLTGFYSASTKRDSTDMAKVFFSDFPVVPGGGGRGEPGLKPRTIPARFGPRKEGPNNTRLKMYLKDDRAYGNLSREEMKLLTSKENVLIVERGSRFRGFINFKLLSREQLLFLVMSLGIYKEHRFCFKVGGAKNRGMGLVRLDIDMESSYYADGLRGLSLGKERGMKELEEELGAVLSRFKGEYPGIGNVIRMMQKEYGVPS